MAEQELKQRRLRLAKRIFKWLGAGVLAILLVLLLIFQAPCKAVIPLALLLGVYVALSYEAQKWLWLAVSIVLIAAIVWIFLPDGDEVWVSYILKEELAGHEARYALPDGQNAAKIYDRLLRGYVPNEWRMRFLPQEAYEQTLSEPWRSQDYPTLTRWLDRHKDVVTSLPEACRIKTCRFPSSFAITAADPASVHRYSALKSWALILLLSGNNDVAEGRPDEGFQKYVYALQIASHLYQQKRTHDFLIGFGIEGIALPRINRFLVDSNVSKEQLQLVTETLGNLDDNWSRDFLQCFEYDRLFVKNAFCSVVYQQDGSGHVRLSHDPAAPIAGFRRPRTPAEAYWQKKSMKASAMLAWFFVPSTPHKAAELIDEVFEPYSPMADPNFPWEKQNVARSGFYSLNCHFLIRLLINRTILQYDGFHDIYPKRLLQRRGTRVLIALKQYRIDNGRWPQDLDAIRAGVPAEALIDPQNNGSFVYELGGQTFTLYGKGRNGIDNDGRRSIFPAGGSTPPEQLQDDVLFWPPRNREAAEEITNPSVSNTKK